MFLSLYFLKFIFLGGGIIIILKIVNVLRIGWVLLKCWLMLVFNGEMYWSRSCFCCWNWNFVDVSFRVVSFFFVFKFYMNCFSGNFLFMMICSLCLVWLIVGEMWLKFIYFDWNVLLSWERKGRMCLRIYICLMNLGWCIFFSSL